MSLNTFGVTAAIEYADMFPQWGAPDANSSPTSTTVGRFINEEAADLAARLYAENVVAADIAAVANEVAYTWCAKTLKLMVARRIFAVASQSDPELRRSYGTELDARLKLLAEQGGTALGDSSLATGTSPADGPTSHVSVNSLEQLAGEDMSDVIPLLQKKDRL